MSFSSLPTELVRQIIESTVPSTFHSSTYEDRQATLRSLCLVNRRFRQIAQPFLFRVVFVKNASTLVGALDSSAQLALSTSVHQVVVPDSNFDKSCFEQLSSLCSSLKTLHLYGNTINIFLSLSSQIETLQLCLDGSIFDAFTLPRLRSLTLWQVPETSLKALVNPDALPSLRAFALVDTHTDDAASLARTEILKLLPQLDMVSFDLGLWRGLDPTLRRAATAKSLVDGDYDSLDRAFDGSLDVHHLRILGISGAAQHDTDHPVLRIMLSKWISALREEEQTLLSTIVLDDVRPTLHSLGVSFEEEFEEFVRACQKKKIEILWEETPADFHVDNAISPMFWSRQRERRKLEESK